VETSCQFVELVHTRMGSCAWARLVLGTWVRAACSPFQWQDGAIPIARTTPNLVDGRMVSCNRTTCVRCGGACGMHENGRSVPPGAPRSGCKFASVHAWRVTRGCGCSIAAHTCGCDRQRGSKRHKPAAVCGQLDTSCTRAHARMEARAKGKFHARTHACTHARTRRHSHAPEHAGLRPSPWIRASF
jgi:hypothetical protein